MTEVGMTEHDAVTRAIETSGLTITEVADRAGLNPAHLDRFPMVRVPLAVLARLADVVGLPVGRLVHHWWEDAPLESGDSSVIGAYLAEFRDGLMRDELAEALDWTLLRVERGLAMLDSALQVSGMRLGLRADRIVVVGRLDRTELSGRLILERLTAGSVDPTLARFVWAALDGIAPEKIQDREVCDAADRLGLTWGWQGRIRVSEAVESSLYPASHPHSIEPRC